MFYDACRIHEETFCKTLHLCSSGLLGSGSGCIISPRHAVSALHVFANAAGDSFPAVQAPDGMWRCSIAQEFKEWDFVVLRMEEKLSQGNSPMPSVFPDFHVQQMGFGTTVGYMTWLHKTMQKGPEMFKYFATASLSFLIDEVNGSPRWVLTPSFTEPGFSGSPVFNSAGVLLGLIVGILHVPANSANSIAITHGMPYMTIFPRLSEALQREIMEAKTNS